MRNKLERRWQYLRKSAGRTLDVLGCWRRHEWHSLKGHWYALLARGQLALVAPSLRQLVSDQVDLLPESRLRLRRNAEARRVIRSELAKSLRQMVRAPA